MILLLATLAGCLPDDWNGQPYEGWEGDTGDTSAPATALVGAWLSESSDLSELFASDSFDYRSVEADFRNDATYTVVAKAGDGTTYTLVGTYTTDEGTDPAAISLHQGQPYEAIAEGIWAVDGDTLTYEVVQTAPDYGFVPPTPEGGFGSTSGPNMDPGINVQTYRRQP